MKFGANTVFLAFCCGCSTMAMFALKTTSAYVFGTVALLGFLNAIRCEILLQRKRNADNQNIRRKPFER